MLKGLLTLWVFLASTGLSLAQDADTLARPLRPTVVPADTLVRVVPCPGVERAAVSTILFAGNSVTKERILRAELDFREGDTLMLADLSARLEANRSRLFNLQLFHAVVAQASCASGRLIVVFGVQERWYTFPVPIFSLADRNLRSWSERPDRWRRVDYGVHVVRSNFRGRNEQIIANLQLGFNRKYELFYEAPGLGTHRRIGFGAGASFYQSRTLDYVTRTDRLVALRAEQGFPIQRFYATAGLRFRHTVQFLTALDASYHREQINDSVNFYNPNYYQGRTQREFLDLTLTSTRNQRNTFAYPLTGQYAQARLTHRVFLDNTTPSLTTLRLKYARYVPLGREFYYAAGVSGQARLTRHLAYADSRALGYEDLVRGYDEYVIDGRHYGLLQQGLSYRLFHPEPVRLPSVSNAKINTIPLAVYLNIFADAGYVVSSNVLPENRLPNHFLSAIGLGLHLVTYYDRVFTAEYTLNGLGQTGYFFRAEFPI
ncbi:BamA/TamA family outer membrane protein [Hymenobacter arizonensis]|uniref:Surface antigen n=1 Tax=Hymenobacter arizonensis TaxID=1227077 RepID=A0A1I5Y5D6_HYMAR|nr:BamA/TamA family outer membrane protein [Hymenobacter arizonensis]SFQ39374.1 Surface antigen [Hymenobacter arizonensis]